MIELDILIEEIELSHMSRVSKKYIYENLLDIRQKLTKKLTLCDVSNTEGKLQAVEDLKDLCYDVCPLDRRDDLSEIVNRL